MLTRRANRAFTIVEFTLSMLLILVVMAASALTIERALRNLHDGVARDGASELAYQTLAKERVFNCGLGTGADVVPNVPTAAGTSTSTVLTARARLCGTVYNLAAGAGTDSDPTRRCTGDVNDPTNAKYIPGGCFDVAPDAAGNGGHDDQQIRYRVYVRSFWRSGGVPNPTTSCYGALTSKRQPLVLLREVSVTFNRGGAWSEPVRVTGANMVPDEAQFSASSNVYVAVKTPAAGTMSKSQPVTLNVTTTSGASHTLTRWSDDSGCVWFPFIPANATVSSPTFHPSPVMVGLKAQGW